MELFVIRHTEVNNPENLCYGNYDIPLMKDFNKKSKQIFQNLPSDLDQIYTSPSKRCVDLLNSQNKNFITIKELQELNFGDWEGKKWDEINQNDLNYWMENFVNTPPQNGENMIQLFDRTIEFTYKLLDLNFKKVLFVTHSGVIRSLLSEALKIKLDQIFDISVRFDEIYRFSFTTSKKPELYFLDKKDTNTNKVISSLTTK